jgi:hypothetical protein
VKAAADRMRAELFHRVDVEDLLHPAMDRNQHGAGPDPAHANGGSLPSSSHTA